MNLYLLMILVLTLIGIKITIKTNNKNYLSKENTSCIKGIFIFDYRLRDLVEPDFLEDFYV